MVVAIGFFDGVHIGHRAVIDSLIGAARERGTGSLIITFWPHPRNVLQDGAASLRLLNSPEEKRSRILELGVDRVEVMRFTREFSSMTARRFLEDVVKGDFGATAIVLGYDNRLGSDGLGRDEIASLAVSIGLDVIDPPSVRNGQMCISSSRIREALAHGDVRSASAMLGYDYSLSGVVVEGNRIGRTLGFPTANMQVYDPLKAVPEGGVYLVDVETAEGRFRGMTNIGTRPTVTGVEDGDRHSSLFRTIETNIFGFDSEIYGLDLKISFLGKIRDEVKFDSLDGLKRQLCMDKEACLRFF